MSVLPSGEAGFIALIEHLRASGVCSNPRKVAIVRRNEGTKQAVVFLPPCKTWACPECAARNSDRWKHRVMYGVSHYQKSGKEFDFVTITLGGKYRGRDDSIQGWRRVWPRVYDRHTRVAGKQPYVIFPECHKNGRVHLHMVIGKSVDKRWWKDNVYGCGGGFIADCQPIRRIGGVAYYVTKYIAKTIALAAWPRKFKRVRASHHWPKPPVKPLDPESVYTVLNPAQLGWTVAWLWRMGFDVRQGAGSDLVEMVDL